MPHSSLANASTAEDWAPHLNAAQRHAATFGVRANSKDCPPLLIIAGAGTGKTNTLAHRVAYLLLNGVAPERILLLTFTRRAAQEMTRRAERIAAQVQSKSHTRPSAAPKIAWAGTFHSIANRLLREQAHAVGLDPSFSILDRGDAADLMDVSRQELGLAKKEKRFPRKDTCLAIYSHKLNTQWPLERTLEEQFPWCAEWREELTRLFVKYMEVKRQQQALDYDDLLLYWHIAMQDATFARHVSGLFDHVLVDEYQDTNVLQADILLAMKPSGGGLCVVGDDAQAIYSFRAASVENILCFPQRFTPHAEIAKLEHNYRSVQPILDAANALIAEAERQYQKELVAARPSQQLPRYVSVADDRAQADYIVENILAAREAGVLLKQQAVLMRNSHHSDLLEVELARRNIPYVKYGGLKFLEAAHVKDVLAILKWADNPKNRIAGFRTLQLLPGIGPNQADRCLNVLQAGGYSFEILGQYQQPKAAREEWSTTTALLQSLAQSSQWPGQLAAVRKWYEPHLQRIYDSASVRLNDIEQLERIAASFPNRERFLSELTLDPPQASGDLSGPPLLDEDYLILSTIHSAKGQEWHSVYLLNAVEGNIPNEFSGGKPELLEEERRLLYVAMTRAKQDLHLVAPLKYYLTQQARLGDKHIYGTRSRFLTDAVLAKFESMGWPQHASTRANPSSISEVRIDVQAKLREFWR